MTMMANVIYKVAVNHTRSCPNQWFTSWSPVAAGAVEHHVTTGTSNEDPRTAISGGGAIWSLALSKDNASLFAACDDGTIRILSLDGGVGSCLGLVGSRELYEAHSDAVGHAH